MMSALQCIAASSLWYMASLPESLRLRRALADIAGAQERLLLQTLRGNRDTEFGRRLGFAGIQSVADYQSRVPLSTYEDYREAVGRIEAGERHVLTTGDVLMMEPTSGSTAATKHIPYTAALKTEFGRGIAPWLTDLYQHDPRLMCGKAYWSVTPVAHHNEKTAAGIPIGFEEDDEYFGRFQRYLVRAAMAVPGLVRLIDDIDAFRYVTLLFLLRNRSLALVSVWNPTFLSLLVEPLPLWWQRLAADIAHGTLSPPAPIAGELLGRLQSLNPPDPRRARQIRAVFQKHTGPGEVHTGLWPNLRLISCWADATAAVYARRLARLFPRARIQGKGLIATEGFVSLPVTGRAGAMPAIRSHFLEFLPAAGEPARPLLVHELEDEQCYEVIVTTGGGLYRYRLLDLVRVVDRYRGCPLIRFVGKAANVSDRFGEKLNERHVRQALDVLLNRRGINPDFAMVAYEESFGRPAYVLFIEAHGQRDAALYLLGADLEAALTENYHYQYCRKLGQLAPLRVVRVERDGMATYLAVCQRHGQRLGDIKPVALHRMSGWAEHFRGPVLSPSEAVRR